MAEGRPSRVRAMPPDEIDARASGPTEAEAELVHRLERALALLPAAERTAVIAAIGFGGGSVGAAMELGLDPHDTADAEALTQSGLQLLRGALADLDPHGLPLT